MHIGGLPDLLPEAGPAPLPLGGGYGHLICLSRSLSDLSLSPSLSLSRPPLSSDGTRCYIIPQTLNPEPNRCYAHRGTARSSTGGGRRTRTSLTYLPYPTLCSVLATGVTRTPPNPTLYIYREEVWSVWHQRYIFGVVTVAASMIHVTLSTPPLFLPPPTLHSVQLSLRG